MKKLLSLSTILILLGTFVPAFSSEIEEDYFDMASGYCVVGDYDSAMQYLDKILKMNPNNRRAIYLKKGLTHVMSEDKKSFVENVNPYIKQAMEYKRIGDAKSELDLLIKGTRAQNSYLAYYYLGNYYRENKDYMNAIDAYNNSVSARSDFSPSYMASAITLYEIGKYASVINPIDKYLTYNPEDDLAYAIKSRAQIQLGDIAQAKENINKAISINDCPEYQFDRAKILYVQGDYKNAKNLLKTLIASNQTSEIYQYIGLCDFGLKNYSSALINLDKAIILSDDDRFLEAKYNEIKSIMEAESNGQN